MKQGDYENRISATLNQCGAVLTWLLINSNYFGNIIANISDKKGNEHVFILDRGTVTKDGTFLNQLDNNNVDGFIKCIIDYLKMDSSQ